MAASSSNHFFPTLLLIVVAAGTTISTTTAASTAIEETTEFIKTSCSITTYPKLCIRSLSSHANAIQTSTKLLTHTALSVTLNTAKSTSDMMQKLSHTHGLNTAIASAMRDCVDEVSDSVYELKKSLGEMSRLGKGSKYDLVMSDVETWVSAALTDDDTCMEGFRNDSMNGEVKDMVRGKILKITHLTSNALALINSYASSLH